MSIKLMMEIERAHARLDAIEQGVDIVPDAFNAMTARVEKLEGEIKAMKARMGKHVERAEI